MSTSYKSEVDSTSTITDTASASTSAPPTPAVPPLEKSNTVTTGGSASLLLPIAFQNGYFAFFRMLPSFTWTILCFFFGKRVIMFPRYVSFCSCTKFSAFQFPFRKRCWVVYCRGWGMSLTYALVVSASRSPLCRKSRICFQEWWHSRPRSRATLSL